MYKSTTNNVIIQIKLTYHEAEILESVVQDIINVVNYINKNNKKKSWFKTSLVRLPTRHHQWAVLNSPFVNKNSQTRFVEAVHSRLVTIVVDSNFNFKEISRINIPEYIQVKINIIESNQPKKDLNTNLL